MRRTSPLRKRAKPHDSCDPAQSPTYVHLLPDDMPAVDFLDALVVAKPVETVEVEPEAVAVAGEANGGSRRSYAAVVTKTLAFIGLGVVAVAVASKNGRKRVKLAQGVYIEEVSSGSRPIQAVGTAVAAFVGLYPGKP